MAGSHYANETEKGLIGCVNTHVSIIPGRESRTGGESDATSVRVPLAVCAPAPCSSASPEHVPKLAWLITQRRETERECSSPNCRFFTEAWKTFRS